MEKFVRRFSPLIVRKMFKENNYYMENSFYRHNNKGILTSLAHEDNILAF